MHMLKCYLANDREGHFMTAGEAMSAPGQVWSCASCGCRLVLHAGAFSDPAMARILIPRLCRTLISIRISKVIISSPVFRGAD